MKNSKTIRFFCIFLVLIFIIGCVQNQTSKMLDELNNWKRPKVNLTKKQVIEYFENKTNDLDQIEGIWVKNVSFKFNMGVPGEQPNKTTQTRKNVSKVAIMKINKYYFTMFFFEPLTEGNISNFGEIYGTLQSTLTNNNYTFQTVDGPSSVPTSTSEFNLIFNEDKLSGIQETKSRSQYMYMNNSAEYLFVKDSEFIGTQKSRNKTNKNIISGSGSIISNTGIVVTNYHVVEESSDIIVFLPKANKEFKADLILKDKNNDLAILKLQDFIYNNIFSNSIPFSITSSSNSKLGEDVFTLGFPLGEILGKTSKFSSGKINSLFGIQDDPRVFQISNPIQPGNSGGPLFNSNGEFIGIVFSSLNAKFFYENANIIPQNVNFAVKSNYLLNLISLLPEEKEISNRKNSLSNLPIEKQIELIQPFIVNIKAR